MADTILIVDDEEPVRRTFREWLDGANLGCTILAAADAAEALTIANCQTIDLAILDWNLGAGHDGLRLLEDLYLFNADVIAIMVTGYAHQATPLDAMRMGVRDYLDKNQDLTRDKFLASVRKQLDHIRPAKRERQLHQSLLAFREAVEKIVPLVRAAGAITDPVPLPNAVRSLLGFLIQITGAADGVLVARSYDANREPAEIYRAYDRSGAVMQQPLVPFARSIAGTVTSMQEPCAMNQLATQAVSGGVELQPFERARTALLAAPLTVVPGVHVVLELFDKKGGFGPDDHRVVVAVADFGVELLRQAMAERQTQRVLLQAVVAALGASEHLTESLRGTPEERREEPPPVEVMDRLREGLQTSGGLDADAMLQLAEAIRVLALRHGDPALHHCIRLVEDLRRLLDTVTGDPEVGSQGSGVRSQK
jgi:ActR/RegA family two-component response regulator